MIMPIPRVGCTMPLDRGRCQVVDGATARGGGDSDNIPSIERHPAGREPCYCLERHGDVDRRKTLEKPHHDGAATPGFMTSCIA